MIRRAIGLLVCTAVSGPALAQSLSTYGSVGLIDMPTAEVTGDGHIGLTYGSVGSSGRASINFQLAPRIEGTLHYTALDDIAISGSRSDRNFDLKINLVREGDYIPSVSVGIRDFLGTGIYSSEYLVATKTVYPGLKVTVGLGWGRLAGDRAFDNPVGGTRDNPAGGTEQFNSANFFQGPDVGLFGGVEWQPEGSPWRLKAEYSPDTYSYETALGDFNRDNGWNFGIERTLSDGLDAGLYWMGGNEIGFRLSFLADPRTPRTPQDLLNGPGPFTARPATAKGGTAWADSPEIQGQLMDGVAKALDAEGIQVTSARLAGREVEFRVENTRHDRSAKAVGRTARILAAGMPPSVETFRITMIEADLPTATVVVNRTDLEQLVDTHRAVPDSWERFEITNARAAFDPTWQAPAGPAFSYDLSPKLKASRFGGDIDVDAVLEAKATYQVAPAFSLNAAATQLLPLINNTSSQAPGVLPQVRSGYADYRLDGPILDRLSADYVTKIGDRVYGRASVGYLERMFGGVSAEVLYKDVTSPLAYGLEVNYLQQREAGSLLDFDDYDVLSGHGSLYWDTGWNNVHAQVDAGRYLAGDWGATVSLSRRFANGWEVAGFMTKTDADTSGSRSGNFDKGVMLTIPLGWTLPTSTRNKVTMQLRDVSRDDGARLNVANRLYPTVRDVDRARLGDNWSAFWQ